MLDAVHGIFVCVVSHNTDTYGLIIMVTSYFVHSDNHLLPVAKQLKCKRSLEKVEV